MPRTCRISRTGDGPTRVEAVQLVAYLHEPPIAVTQYGCNGNITKACANKEEFRVCVRVIMRTCCADATVP